MKKRLLAGLLATSIALSISMGAFPAMAATNDDFVEDREDIADYTDDSYSSGYSSSEQLFDDIIFFDLDEEVDDTAAEVIAEEDANDSSDTEIDRAADSIEETEPEDEVQNTDAAEDRNDREYPDEETKSGTNPGEAGPSDAETEEDVPDSWEETPKIDSELEAAIASEDPFSYYDDDASEEEMDDDIALLAAGKTMAHEDYAYTDVSSGTEYMVNLYTDHTAKIWKLTTSSGGAECILPSTIYYTGDDGVPEPNPYTVTELSLSYWSGVTSDNNNYTALVLPDTLTDIGGSLSGFKNVTEITIPGSVKVFKATLQNMKELKTLTFEEGVEEIASGSVVSGCKSLTTIHLPSSLQKLSGTGTFSGASALTDITLPEGIAITEGSTFSECTSLESIELPASITTIPSSMFAGCSALERVTAKGTITAIGNGAFGSVTDWKDQEIADTVLTEIPDLSQVTSIGDRAFYGCSALETVDLHSVTTMGYGAFQGCDALSGEIDLSNLEVIPGHAFCYDPNITSVITCPTLRSIGDWAFIWADISTISLPETLNSIGTYTFYKASLSGTVALPDSLTQLGASAFSGCEEVNAIQIGSGLKDIPANAFAGCTNLKTITVNNRREDVTIPKIDGVTVTYTIPSLEATDDKVSNAEGALSLQQAVDQANGPVTIEIEKDIRLDEPVRIAAGQRVEITANANENYNLFGNKDEKPTNLFVVEEGGELSLTGALTLGGWNNTGSILVNHGKTTIDGNVVIEKSTLEGDSMGVIEDNGSSAELILENGTIQNHKIRGALSASIRVTEGASFTMNGGTIQDNIANTSSSDSSSPAVLLLGASTFTMNGGSICNNSGQCGTAVYLTASSNAAKARFTMNGGSLSNNESRSYTPNSTPTGAVFVKYSAEFVLNDGTITGNQASHGGGGIGANGGVVIGEATSLSYSISVKKAWDNPGYEDTQPSGVTIHLKERDTGDIVSTAELTGENGWQHTFTDLPLSPDHYTVTEQPLEGYKATYYQDADGNFIITNTYLTTPTPDVPAVTISVPVEKKWVNDYKWERPASIHVSLWNGDAKVKEADLTADMGWTYIFEDLPEGTYSVTEDAVPGYETLIERSDAGGFIITNTYERPLYPEPIEPIDPIPPVDPPQEEIVTPPIVPGTTGNEPNPPSTEETTSVPPTEPTEESTEESTEERSAESDPEESPIKETQETSSVSAKPPKLIQTGQTWWPVFLLMFAGAGLLVFGFYKRSKENIDHE